MRPKIGLIIKNKILKMKKFLSMSRKMLELTAIILAIIGISVLGMLRPIGDIIEPIRTANEESLFNNLRIGFSKDYIINVFGVPPRTTEISYTSTNTKELIIERLDYYELDYICSILTTKKSGVIGYGIISRTASFNPHVPSSAAMGLGENILNNYMGIGTYGNLEFMLYNCTGRADGSNFSMDFYTHHLATDNLWIGYGVSEFGFLDKQERKIFEDYIIEISTYNVNHCKIEDLINSFEIKRNERYIKQSLGEIKPNCTFIMSNSWYEDEMFTDIRSDIGEYIDEQGKNIYTDLPYLIEKEEDIELDISHALDELYSISKYKEETLVPEEEILDEIEEEQDSSFILTEESGFIRDFLCGGFLTDRITMRIIE